MRTTCPTCGLLPRFCFSDRDFIANVGSGRCIAFSSNGEHIFCCRLGQLTVDHSLDTNVDSFELRDASGEPLGRFEVLSQSAGKQIGTLAEFPGQSWAKDPVSNLDPREQALLEHARLRVQADAGRYSRAWAA